MSGLFRDCAVLAGMARRGTASRGPARAEPHSVVTPPALCLMQPPRFNWTRYEHVKQSLHAAICVMSMTLTALVMTTLWWRAAQGEAVSPARWLGGAASGWFGARMFRLGLFVMMAAPRSLALRDGRLRASGLGTVKAPNVLGWRLTRDLPPGMRSCRFLRLEIRCRRFGLARRWTMFVQEGPEANRLRRLLERHLGPSSGVAATPEGTQRSGLQPEDGPPAAVHGLHARAAPVRRLQNPTWRSGEPSLDEVA